MNYGIVAYKAIKESNGIAIERSYAGNVDTLHTKSFADATDWLGKDYANVFHIAWNLANFAEALLSLLPKKSQADLAKDCRLTVDRTKIFYVDRWFGLTTTKPIQGNICQRSEVNVFGIQHWLPVNTSEPLGVVELEKQGLSILDALDKLGIVPRKLTSPVGVWQEVLGKYKLPTTYSNNEIIDASLYCEVMMRREWRSAYKVGYFDKVFSYDMRAAYPFFMSRLPDTDKCKVKYSEQWLKSDWAIVKAEVDITADKTPIVFDTDYNDHILPLGKRIDIFTSEELMWLHTHKAGTIRFIDGYFFVWQSDMKPYFRPIETLYKARQSDDAMVSNLARRIAQGMSGKLDQDNQDGSLGELYNPVLASMTRSRCRLAVADFIWDNALQNALVAVQVDGLLSQRAVPINQMDGIGGWRLDAETEALVLGKGELWRPDKRPLALNMSDVVDAMSKYPARSFFEFGKDKFIDLAVIAKDLDREYDCYPKNGYEALHAISDSKPLATEQLKNRGK